MKNFKVIFTIFIIMSLLSLSAVNAGDLNDNGMDMDKEYPEYNFKKHKGFHCIILATLIGSLAALFDKYLMGVLHVPKTTVQFYFIIELVLIFGVSCLIHRVVSKERTPFKWRWSIAMVGMLLVVTDYVYFAAVSIPGVQIAILSLIRRSSCIVTFVIGYKYFKEGNFKIKLCALIMFLIGIALLAIA